MSLTTSEMTPADIRACTCGNDNYGNGGGMWGDGAWWIIILLLFGWGRNGFGGGAGGNGGIGENYVLATDFATIERKLDSISNGICDSTFALNNTINGNFRTLDGAICNLGYQSLQNTNAIQTQLANCCCDIQGGIKDVAYGNEKNSWNISKQISDCCCDLEKMNMQNRFDAQAYNCNTLQAIDKVGDRIIDYLANEKTQALRDENFALRLAASQSQQNEALLNKLSPCPTPAYFVPNPNCCYNANVTYSNACGCGSF
ncbi:MAG: hypothetical protein IKV64_02685 [Clostridia bacterium]|nr:hypothetical protein [Clostridia bacterium]